MRKLIDCWWLLWGRLRGKRLKQWSETIKSNDWLIDCLLFFFDSIRWSYQCGKKNDDETHQSIQDSIIKFFFKYITNIIDWLEKIKFRNFSLCLFFFVSNMSYTEQVFLQAMFMFRCVVSKISLMMTEE